LESRYSITSGEVKFLVATLGMLHDIGYPMIGNKGKPTHGIAGADLTVQMLTNFDRLITSPRADHEAIKMDFYNAILFHSADKIEAFYTTQIVTNWGSLLANHENIGKILSSIGDPKNNPLFVFDPNRDGISVVFDF
jgi:hypothetical protein